MSPLRSHPHLHTAAYLMADFEAGVVEDNLNSICVDFYLVKFISMQTELEHISSKRPMTSRHFHTPADLLCLMGLAHIFVLAQFN